MYVGSWTWTAEDNFQKLPVFLQGLKLELSDWARSVFTHWATSFSHTHHFFIVESFRVLCSKFVKLCSQLLLPPTPPQHRTAPEFLAPNFNLATSDVYLPIFLFLLLLTVTGNYDSISISREEIPLVESMRNIMIFLLNYPSPFIIPIFPSTSYLLTFLSIHPPLLFH